MFAPYISLIEDLFICVFIDDILDAAVWVHFTINLLVGLPLD